jgi:hypothetical protein
MLFKFLKKKKIFYQIQARGDYESLNGTTAYYSKAIYKKKPNEIEINKFIKKCINPDDVFNLNKESIKIKIFELEVVD